MKNFEKVKLLLKLHKIPLIVKSDEFTDLTLKSDQQIELNVKL